MFGGDKNQITIFGQSAGAWSVTQLIISPLTKGLFKRVIIETSSEKYQANKSVALIQAKQLAKALNCTDSKQWLECLRKVDSKVINRIKYSPIHPVVGTDILPSSVSTLLRKRFSKVNL